VRNDVNYTRFLSNRETLVIYDDIWLPHVGSIYLEELSGVLETVNGVFERTPMYSHQLCRFKKPSLALCSLVLGKEFREVTKYSLLSKMHYCIKHNYDLIVDHSVYDDSRPRAWSKIKLLLKYLSSYDYLFWVDADAYIMNMEHSLNGFILANGLIQDTSILVSYDWKMMNTGVMLIRNSDFSREFLTSVYNHGDMDVNGNWEQTAFIQQYEDDVLNSQSHIKSIYHADYNSYWFNYQWGHLIVHFCGCRKLPALQFAMEPYCPVKQFGESEESFQKRIDWIRYKSFEESQIKLHYMNGHG